MHTVPTTRMGFRHRRPSALLCQLTLSHLLVSLVKNLQIVFLDDPLKVLVYSMALTSS